MPQSGHFISAGAASVAGFLGATRAPVDMPQVSQKRGTGSASGV